MEGEGVYERLMDEAAKKYLATGEIEEGNLYSLACAVVDPRKNVNKIEDENVILRGLTTSELFIFVDSLKLAKKRLTPLLAEKEKKEE